MNSVLRKFRRKPLRTFLTVLQIVLGSLAMTLALSTYLDALQNQNKKQADRFDLIAGTKSEDANTGTTTYNLMNQEGVEELLELAPALSKAALIGDVAANLTVEKNGKLYQFQMAGYVNAPYFDLTPPQLTSGSFFTEQEAKTSEAVMLISDTTAKVIFGGAPALGQTLNLMPDEMAVSYDEEGNPLPGSAPEPYKIIGTFAGKPYRSVEQQYGVFLPLWKIPEYYGGASILNVLAKEGQGDEAREQIITAARQVFGTKISEWGLAKDKTFFVSELGENMWMPEQSKKLDPTIVMFGLFGIVALIVGSIGIFSIMLVDALERERDTGIKRALGATKARITREMVLEATLIAGLGGLFGSLLAALVIPWLAVQVGNTLFWNTNLRWQPLAALVVFGVTVVLGAVLGLFPALRAASVKPIEALKGI